MDTGQYMKLFRKIIEAEDIEKPLAAIQSMELKDQRQMSTVEPEPVVRSVLHRIIISEPKTLEDCNQILDSLCGSNVAVVTKYENIDPALATQMINYLCGGVYVLHGRAVRISGNIIVFTGEGVERIF